MGIEIPRATDNPKKYLELLEKISCCPLLWTKAKHLFGNLSEPIDLVTLASFVALAGHTTYVAIPLSFALFYPHSPFLRIHHRWDPFSRKEEGMQQVRKIFTHRLIGWTIDCGWDAKQSEKKQKLIYTLRQQCENNNAL